MYPQAIDELIQRAIAAKDNAYVPYSHFRVGACLLMDNGDYVAGSNVENVSFGATNCAERSALFAAISQGHPVKSVQAIAIAGDTQDHIAPCGICRQVMIELCRPQTPVYLLNGEGSVKETDLASLLPGAFDSLT